MQKPKETSLNMSKWRPRGAKGGFLCHCRKRGSVGHLGSSRPTPTRLDFGVFQKGRGRAIESVYHCLSLESLRLYQTVLENANRGDGRKTPPRPCNRRAICLRCSYYAVVSEWRKDCLFGQLRMLLVCFHFLPLLHKRPAISPRAAQLISPCNIAVPQQDVAKSQRGPAEEKSDFAPFLAANASWKVGIFQRDRRGSRPRFALPISQFPLLCPASLCELNSCTGPADLTGIRRSKSGRSLLSNELQRPKSPATTAPGVNVDSTIPVRATVQGRQWRLFLVFRYFPLDSDIEGRHNGGKFIMT